MATTAASRDEKLITTGNKGVATQIANPSRASWRTFVQAIVPTFVLLNVALPIIYSFLTSPDVAPKLTEILGPVYGWITVGLNAVIFLVGLLAKLAALLMAQPVVNEWIGKHLPWLAPIKPSN